MGRPTGSAWPSSTSSRGCSRRRACWRRCSPASGPARARWSISACSTRPTALLTYQAGNYFATGAAPGRLGNRHPTIAPYETFATADGELALAVGNDSLWQRFCQAAELPEAGADPRFATNAGRLAHYDALKPTLDAAFARRSRGDWTARLLAAGVPCGAVRTVEEVFADPQTAARQMVARVSHASLGEVSVTGVPVKLSGTPGSVRLAPPVLGQHTAAVLGELGYDRAAVDALASSGAVRVH